MKTVSVIIPFYSNIDWLYEAMDSVLAQTYPIHEVILVNDGSKEDMSEFLTMYGDKIIYLYQDNAGPATARNNGIRHATWDYIAFEDSDDREAGSIYGRVRCYVVSYRFLLLVA